MFYFLSDKVQWLEASIKTHAINMSGSVMFIGGPAHDFSYSEDASPKKFYHEIDDMTESLTKLAHSGVSIILDGFLYMRHKNAEFHELQAAHSFYHHMFSNHSLFAYIDMWDWVVREDRSKCMKRDKFGIHFVNDYVRHLHVQTFLNWIGYFQFWKRKVGQNRQ